MSRGRPRPALSAKPIDKTVRNGKPSEGSEQRNDKRSVGPQCRKKAEHRKPEGS